MTYAVTPQHAVEVVLAGVLIGVCLCMLVWSMVRAVYHSRGGKTKEPHWVRWIFG